MISKDVFCITDMAAGIYFWKFCTINKAAAKRYILYPLITFSSSSLFLLIRLKLPSPGWYGNLSLMRRKTEEVKWKDKMWLFAYDATLSTINPCGHIYDIKCIFWAFIYGLYQDTLVKEKYDCNALEYYSSQGIITVTKHYLWKIVLPYCHVYSSHCNKTLFLNC